MSFTGCVWPTGTDCGPGLSASPSRARGGGRTWSSCQLTSYDDRTGLVVPAAGQDGSDLLVAFRMSDGHRTWQVRIPGPVAAPLSPVPGGMLIYTVVPGQVTAP